MRTNCFNKNSIYFRNATDELINGIKFTKLPLSPSNYYLNFQILNEEEQNLLEKNDKSHMENFKQTKIKLLENVLKKSPIKSDLIELKSKVNKLKEQQTIIKNSLPIETVRVELPKAKIEVTDTKNVSNMTDKQIDIINLPTTPTLYFE